MRFLFLCFVSLFALWGMETRAQTYSFKSYTIEDGLPRSQVLCIYQQKEGFLWFGTAGGGASRFDGRTFTTFNTRNGLVNNYVNAICETKSGELWFATEGGVSRFNGKNFESYSTREGLASPAIVSIFEDSKGNIWFRSMEEGVSFLRASDHRIITFNSKNGLPDNVLFDVVEDADGAIWFSSFQGAIRYDKGKLQVFTAADGLGNDKIRCILKTHDKLLLGTWGGGVSQYNPGEKKLFSPLKGSERLSSSIVLSLAEGEKGETWAGTLGDGIVKIANDKAEMFNSNAGQGQDYINKIHLDHSGGLWAIGSNEGLYKYSISLNEPPTPFNTHNGFNDDRVTCFYEDREGNMWFGTYTGGASKYNGDVFASIGRGEGLGNTSISAISEDVKGSLLIGTDGGSVGLYSKATSRIVETYNTKTQVSSGFISCISKDAYGNQWIGTDNGLSIVYQGHRKAFFNKFSRLQGNNVKCILHTSGGKTYVCTDEGISLFKGLSPIRFTYALLRCEAIIEDSKGNIWFLSEKGEIHVLKNGHLIKGRLPYRFSGVAIRGIKEEALLIGTDDNGLIEALLDGQGNISQTVIASPSAINNTSITAFCLLKDQLWIGTSNGLFSLDLQAYKDKGDRKLREFTRDDGLINPVINKNALFADREGLIWVGTLNGASRLNPSLIRKNTELPFTFITGVRLFYNSFDPGLYSKGVDNYGLPVEMELPYDKNQITFEFTGVSLTAPSRVKYRYKLGGLEENWSPATSNNFIPYSNIPPGKYTFMVISSNSDGLWNTKPAVFSFSIRTPFWRSWWFYSVSGAFVLLLLYLLSSYRIRQVRKNASLQRRIIESEQKALRAQMNPHFIFNSLNSIQHFITDKDAKSANRYLSKFSRLMRMILDNSKKPFISLSEELDALRLYLDLESLRFENKFEYTVDIDPSVDIYNVEIPPMLIQPYLENAIWHGFSNKKGRGEISISFKIEGKLLVCSVKDNGIGRKRSGEMKIEHPAQHNSSGMRITSERLQSVSELKEVEGSVEVIDLVDDAGEGLGTMVNIKVPLE